MTDLLPQHAPDTAERGSRHAPLKDLRPLERGTGRPTTTQRGYGAEHQRLRRDLTPTVEAGQAKCWRCGQPIKPGSAWDVGHDDHDRSIIRGPEHAGRECPAGGNRATAGRRQWKRPAERHPGLHPSPGASNIDPGPNFSGCVRVWRLSTCTQLPGVGVGGFC